MAKPVITFKASKWSAGGQTGYKPLLEACVNKVTDLALAEEICIEKRLSCSPEELYYNVKTALEAVPYLMSIDGRVREFTSLLRWNRTASGTLDGVGGAWNDSCKANIKPQLLASTKLTIDGTFVNELNLPKPKCDNVTWIGAQTTTNCIKVLKQFAAYGRNMQFIDGDEAALWINRVKYSLTCTSSDSAHAVFNWPTEAGQPEAGTTATFVMSSRAGVEEGTFYTSTKNVVILAADAVLPTVDYVMTEGGTEHNKLTLSELFNAHGSHLQFDESLGDHAYIVHPEYGECGLNVVESSDAKIEFAWPTMIMEPCTVSFKLVSRGGVAGAEPTTNIIENITVGW